MATKTENAFNEFGGWQEWEYRSTVHGGIGYYWERRDGLRLSQRTSGAYYPAGVGPRRGRPPRFVYWDELPGGGNAHPEGGWGGYGDAGSFHEHLEAEMNSNYEGEHVRFVYRDILMDSVGEEVYPAEWKHEGRLIVQKIAKWAEKRWPIGKTAKWPTLGVAAELS